MPCARHEPSRGAGRRAGGRDAANRCGSPCLRASRRFAPDHRPAWFFAVPPCALDGVRGQPHAMIGAGGRSAARGRGLPRNGSRPTSLVRPCRHRIPAVAVRLLASSMMHAAVTREPPPCPHAQRPWTSTRDVADRPVAHASAAADHAAACACANPLRSRPGLQKGAALGARRTLRLGATDDRCGRPGAGRGAGHPGAGGLERLMQV